MRGWKKSKEFKQLEKKRIKTWMLLVIALVATLGTVLALRHNNLKMVELRERVIAADKAGEGVAESLQNLNEYIFKHMNTQVVRPIELVNTYNRQAEAAIQAAQEGGGRDIYAEGTAACERRGIPLSSIAQCITEYANNNASSLAEQNIELPDKDLFIYSFTSPAWTPDLAGFLVILTVVMWLWLLMRLVEYVTVRLVVRYRLKNGF